MANGNDNTGKFKKQADLLKAVNQQSKELNLSEQARLKLESDILDRSIKSSAQLQKQVELAQKADAITRQRLSTEEKIAEAKKKQQAVDEIGVDLAKDLEKAKSSIVDYDQDALDKSKELLNSTRKQIAVALQNGDITQDRAYAMREIVKEREKEIEALGKAGEKAGRMNEQLQGAFEGAKKTSMEFFSSFPGGEALAKMIGLDAAFEMVGMAGKAAINAATQAMIAGQGPLAALKAGMAAFNAVVAINPVMLVIAAVATLIGLLHQQTKAMKEQAKIAGVSVLQAKQQMLDAKAAAQQSGVELVTSKEILKTQNAINNAIGTSLAINAENAAQVAEVGEAFGIGAEEAGKTAAALLAVGASQSEVAKMMEETNLMAAQAGVDMGKVQADIAENAEEASKYLSGNPEAIRDAAIEAAKLGVSLKNMVGIADSLLDIESSLQNQFEANAMLGRQMNFDKARQLALEGDIAGASKAVLEQVGSIADFENMNVKQKEKLAKAAGMEVGELEKSLRIQELRGKMTDEELAAAQGLNLSAAELKNMTSEELAEKVKSKQASEKAAAAMAQMKDQLMLALQPLLDMVGVLLELLAPVFKILGVFQQIAGVIFKVILSPLKIISGILGAFMDALQPIMDIFNEIGEALGGGDGLGEMFSKIGKLIGTVLFAPLKLIGSILKAVLVPIIQKIGEAFNFVGTIIDNIGKAIDTFLIKPIEKAIDALSKLNPSNWFGGDDEAEVSVTADGEPLSDGGSVDDGVIQNGKVISTNPADTIIATKEPSSFMSKLGDVASSAMSMTPLGMAANAIGGLFGGDDSGGGGGDADLAKAINELNRILAEGGIVATVTDDAIRTIGNKNSANKSMG